MPEKTEKEGCRGGEDPVTAVGVQVPGIGGVCRPAGPLRHFLSYSLSTPAPVTRSFRGMPGPAPPPTPTLELEECICFRAGD